MESVLDVESAQTRKRHIEGLCKTRWVERHTCFETFQEVYEYVCISLEAISWPHLHPELELVTPSDLTSEKWNWQRDRDTTVKAQRLLASLQKPEFIMAFVVVKNCLQLLRGMTTKLQKRDIDIVSAYNMIDDTKKKITDLRANIGREHVDWYNEAQQMAKKWGKISPCHVSLQGTFTGPTWHVLLLATTIKSTTLQVNLAPGLVMITKSE